jgi:hypothetical protein
MELTQESFDRLLTWLHSHPEEAGKRYVQIRSDLVRRFASHHCAQPERLADITLDRVAMKLAEIIDTFVGEPERYIHRVAFFVLLESRARTVNEMELNENLPVIKPEEDENLEAEHACLEKCLGTLSLQKRELIKSYYDGYKAAKIKRRKELAVQHNIEQPILRVTVLRIRKNLKSCILDCLRTMGR